MVNQQTFDFDRITFDLQEGERRKEEGLAQAQAPLSRKQLLEIARLCAIRIARREGSVTSDDVFYEMLREGFDPTALGPAAGCVFRDKCFEFTGEWKKSQRLTNHASDLRVWRLKAVNEVAMKTGVSIELARQYAVRIARGYGYVTYDDVFVSMLRDGLNPAELGPAAGQVFRGEEFIFTGRWEKSQRANNHARMNRVWQLRAGSLEELVVKKSPAQEEVEHGAAGAIGLGKAG